MNFPDYSPVTYKEFQRGLAKTWADYLDKGGNEVKLAALLKVKTTQTVRNSFNTDKQGVSDAILSKVCDCIGFEGFIVWNRGVRQYYSKSK